MSSYTNFTTDFQICWGNLTLYLDCLFREKNGKNYNFQFDSKYWNKNEIPNVNIYNTGIYTC
jgi:hypothetical protein